MICKHERLEGGYASNPPSSRCMDCGGYFTVRELVAEKRIRVRFEKAYGELQEENAHLRAALKEILSVATGIWKDDLIETNKIALRALELCEHEQSS